MILSLKFLIFPDTLINCDHLNKIESLFLCTLYAYSLCNFHSIQHHFYLETYNVDCNFPMFPPWKTMTRAWFLCQLAVAMDGALQLGMWYNSNRLTALFCEIQGLLALERALEECCSQDLDVHLHHSHLRHQKTPLRMRRSRLAHFPLPLWLHRPFHIAVLAFWILHVSSYFSFLKLILYLLQLEGGEDLDTNSSSHL